MESIGTIENVDDLNIESALVLYDEMRLGVIDVSSMSEKSAKSMKSFVYNHGNTGDTLRLRVETYKNEKSSGKTVVESVFVKDGTFVETSSLNNNLFLPFEGAENLQQRVLVGTFQDFTEISWDPVIKSVLVDGVVVRLGQPFFAGGRRMSMAKGSVVIVFEDSPAREFPEPGIQSEVINNEGVIAGGDMICSETVLLEQKENAGDTSIFSYVFFHDSSTGQRVCVSKTQKILDFSETSALSKLGIGFVDNASYRSIEDVLEFSVSGVTIRSVSSSGTESISTMDLTGLSFSSDESSVMFGNTFRIKYDEDSDTIQIQHFDTNSNSYITKVEYGR